MSSTMTLPAAAFAERYRRYGRHLPALATAAFAVLFGSALADFAWSLVPVPESAKWRPPPVQATQRDDDRGPDVNAVIQAHLFGVYEPPKVTESTAAAAPETALNLTLVGLLADRDEQYSRALIAVQNGEEGAFAIGDDITRGVALQAIFPDRVILSRNGRLETLSLERDKPTAGTSEVTRFDEEEEDDDGTSASSSQLAQIREEILQDPAKASTYIRVQPANVGGQLKGYRIYPGRNRKAFSEAGLRPGDLVTAVNGVQLDDPAKALQLLSDLSQAGQFNLVLERGGQTQNISINLN